MVKKISAYIELIKITYQMSFVEVLLGIFIGLSQPKGESISAMNIILLFLSFGIFLYGGIYTLNDIRDAKEDQKNEKKRFRPIPSGRITPRAALVYSIILIALGLIVASYVLGKTIVAIYLLFLVINVAYTHIFKRIPFVEFIANSLTHPLRIILGIVVTGTSIPLFFIGSYFWFIMGQTSMVRRVMKKSKGAEQRPTMRYYTHGRLLFLEIVSFFLFVVLALFDREVHRGVYVFMALWYCVVVFDIPFFRAVQRFFEKIYTFR